GLSVTYSPASGECGFVERFTYDAQLGGAATGRAEVRVTVPCECGNGVVDPGETCDDGNAEAGDGCSPGCQGDGECGNGGVAPGGTCEEGSAEAGDGCSPGGEREGEGGNGVGEMGEACDAGNTTAGDGCSPVCSIEIGAG